ncbi:MAG: TlyA family RNA methyltransferase [Anaerolineae bacterium]|nr:TlyA family RNA methyltransferase [Anaerolineae bacterium]
MAGKNKVRLDVLLAERGLAPSREAARRMIMAGEVQVNGALRDKPGMRVAADAAISVRQAPRFVSRGGDKLAAALAAFPVSIAEQVCADVGASTGGFTDCLLKHGAARVYAIDVGYGQLDYRLRSDPRVIVMERTNARYVETLDEPVSVVVVDASFISLRLLLPVFRRWLTEPANVIVLIKPQFEAGKGQIGKGGVVRDPDVHHRVLSDVLAASVESGYTVQGVIPSPLKGPAGNIEFLAWLAVGRREPSTAPDDLINAAVAASRSLFGSDREPPTGQVETPA